MSLKQQLNINKNMQMNALCLIWITCAQTHHNILASVRYYKHFCKAHFAQFQLSLQIKLLAQMFEP